MSLRSLIKRKLEDATGVYQPNHFLITLDAGTRLFVPDDHPKTDNLHVFIHEYWHYWQNISTVSGFRSFAFTQRLLSHFGNTLRNDGTSRGSVGLDSSSASDVAALLMLARNLDGDGAPNSDWAADFDLSLTITGVRDEDGTLIYRTVQNPRSVVEVDVKWPDGRSETGEMALGSLAVEESTAFLVEDQIRHELAGASYEAPPEFPYRVVERVYEYIMGTNASYYYPAALGTLALLATHPGPALVAIVRMFKKALDAGKGDAAALQEVTAKCLPILHTRIDTILTTDLVGLVRMHRGRGLLEGALNHLSGLYRAALGRRRKEPLFDLDWLFPNVNIDGMRAHLTSFPSCDVLQESPDSESFPRDALYGFDFTPQDSFGHRPTDYLRSLQAQQDFLYAHVDFDSGEFIASDKAKSRCPFYNACSLPFRVHNPQVCGKRPWESYSGAGHGCWYSTAVAASLGPVKIRKVNSSG